ncbi:4Fe-4S dicluster domain-containing protein [Raoultibacter phocaeensis]|uniref:4Fe-4S dicluster domain-containing protein n=1 Tax=Raoultibacter phocaeensis TaxID=2479841 RepID=UPI00111A84A9|nr:4Fe-4S dicluster domain-containing protein [Raoultibacter phocaeensis]
MSDIQYGMVIDTTRCFGCQTCVVSCKVCNEITGDRYWNRIESLDGDTLYQATGTFPDVRLSFRPLVCNHCEKPSCVANCPTGAMQKDESTGIVSNDAEVCIGCGTCVAACPYSMPVVDEEANLSTKCNFCAGRVSTGELPFCVESCPGQARFFGDINNPESEVSKLIMSKNGHQWKEEEGTGPSVYYI